MSTFKVPKSDKFRNLGYRDIEHIPADLIGKLKKEGIRFVFGLNHMQVKTHHRATNDSPKTFCVKPGIGLLDAFQAARTETCPAGYQHGGGEQVIDLDSPAPAILKGDQASSFIGRHTQP